MKHLIVIISIFMLTACAGSPARNAMVGNGLVCTPPACDQTITFAERLKQNKERETRVTSGNSTAEMLAERDLKLKEIEERYEQSYWERRSILASIPNNYGMIPANYATQIKQQLKYILKDPSSAQYEFVNMSTDTGYIANLKPKPAVPITILKFKLNAKNSYGGYVGFTSYFCSFDLRGTIQECDNNIPKHWKTNIAWKPYTG